MGRYISNLYTRAEKGLESHQNPIRLVKILWFTERSVSANLVVTVDGLLILVRRLEVVGQ